MVGWSGHGRLCKFVRILYFDNHRIIKILRHWCSGNINPFQGLALDSISRWRTHFLLHVQRAMHDVLEQTVVFLCR